jgi:hypothetical protein
MPHLLEPIDYSFGFSLELEGVLAFLFFLRGRASTAISTVGITAAITWRIVWSLVKKLTTHHPGSCCSWQKLANPSRHR